MSVPPPVPLSSAATVYAVRRTREHRGPAFLAPPDALDQVEVVDLDTAETVLLWDCAPRRAGRLVRLLRTDLHRHDAPEFYGRWAAVDDAEIAGLG